MTAPPLAADRRLLRGAVEETLERLRGGLARPHAFAPRAVGTVRTVGRGVAVVEGLPGVRAEEILLFTDGTEGWAFDVEENRVGAVLLGGERRLRAGSEVRRTGRVLRVPVGDALLGRVVDPLGRPLDGAGPVRAADLWTAEREAPAILDRSPVNVPLQTGIKVVDTLVPVGRGQRELILGDRQTGKTTLALDAILNQRGTGVACVWCAIGQQGSSVARLIAALRRSGALEHTLCVVADAEAPPGVQFIAPYAATSMAEWFVAQGRDALIVYDDLTRHAWAYRTLSLLLRRPPGREAYPGDVFYIHARLLERSAQLRGGGSLTALPIAETEAQNLAAYIPTNLISITDGQIYLSPQLFHKGILPAVDVGRSVSRVGGKAQLPAYRALAELRLAYAQFEELEAFARFGTHLDPEMEQRLERGRRLREVLRQPEGRGVPAAEQIAVLAAVARGIFDAVEPERMQDAEEAVRRAARRELAELCERIERGEPLAAGDLDALAVTAAQAVADQGEGGAGADA